MSPRTVDLHIELPEGDLQDAQMLKGMSVSAMSEGVDGDAIPALILKAAEYLLQGRLVAEYETSMPMGNAEMVQQLAASEARLSTIDIVLHLPVTGAGHHMTTTFPS